MAAFDDVNDRLRFDRMDPIVRNDPATGTASVEEIGYQFAKTREKTIFIDFISGMHPSNCVFIGAADFTPPDNGSVIDWRTFGLMGWDTIDRSVTLERALKRLEEIKVTAIVHEADGKRRLTLAPNAHVKAELLVDTQRGFTVEQYDLWERRNEGDDWGNVTVSGHLKWAQRNDVWLPEVVQFENFGRDSRSCFVTFTWTHVNEPIPDRLFEASSFNVVPGALVMDARKGD
ncbi:hypothetical protein [Planctomicrobium piriforme]|nr:hypothetical protein [Planctomicrobium piriforme]